MEKLKCPLKGLFTIAITSLVLLIGISPPTLANEKHSQASTSPVLIISDIDDTIKQSNLKSLIPYRAIGNKEFFGMSDLYSQWLGAMPLERKIIYVTASPGQMQELGKKFLEKNEYPDGEFFGRRTIFNSKLKFKINTISNIIDSHPGYKIVLIGDNGEQDIQVFSNITNKYADSRLIYSFIHQLYDLGDKARLAPDQVAWLTSGDLALQLWDRELLDTDVTFDLVRNAISQATPGMDEAESIFPKWISCNEFAHSYPSITREIRFDQKVQINMLKFFIQLHCQKD